MNPTYFLQLVTLFYLTRMSGGEPWRVWAESTVLFFYPHQRGCIQTRPIVRSFSRVLPASAGVYLYLKPCLPFLRYLTRIRGGESYDFPIHERVILSYPHKRGCSNHDRFWVLRELLSYPHERGCSWITTALIIPLSKLYPHRRGCFQRVEDKLLNTKILPATAGGVPRTI